MELCRRSGLICNISKVVLSCVAVLLLLLFALLAADGPKADERQEFILCGSTGKTQNDRITAYQKFIEKYPKSSFADDAYLEIVEIQIRRKNFDEARRTLEYIKDNFPNAEKHRKIYIGDIQEKWLPEWELFARQNPVTVANYVELKLAELDYEQSNYDTARNRLQKLIMRTKTPNGLRKSLNPTIRTAFDVHISSLELSLRIAENIGDEAWKRQIKALLQSAGEK